MTMFSTREQRKNKTNEDPVWTGRKTTIKEENPIDGINEEFIQIDLASKQIQTRLKSKF